jgi:hypothetical protein
MAYKVRYKAKRSLALGHTLGTEYEITLTPRSVDREYKISRSDIDSIAGFRYSTVTGEPKQSWRIETTPMTGTEVTLFREFLDSVTGGERFELDIGDGAEYRYVSLNEKRYREARRVRKGDGGGSDYFSFRFTCREK